MLDKGIITVFHGIADNRGAITPEILSKYDVITTIGKTVQYALALGIPVYEYDHFGGDGYITKDNVNLEEMYNFSGRATRRKLTGAEICDEIITRYEFALQHVKYLMSYAHRYSLSKNVKAYYTNPDYLTSFNSEDERLFQFSIPQNAFLSEELFGHREQLLSNELAYHSLDIQKQLNAYKSAYLSITNSHIWRYTAPIRKFLDWIKAHIK